MSNSKPISYPGLQCVMQYMDPLQRIELIQKSPSTRAAHRTATLKVASLNVKPFSITINNTSYQLGVIRHYPNNETPEKVRKINEEGGMTSGSLKRGIEAPSAEAIAQNFEYEKELLRVLTVLKQENLPETQEKLRWQCRYLREQIEKFREISAISQLHHVNYIQLMTTYNGEVVTKKVEWVKHKTSIKSARDYVFRQIFGTKNLVLLENHLELKEVPDWNGSFKFQLFHPNVLVKFENGKFESIKLPFSEEITRKNMLNFDFINVSNFKFEMKFDVSKSQLEPIFTILAPQDPSKWEKQLAKLQNRRRKKAFFFTLQTRFVHELDVILTDEKLDGPSIDVHLEGVVD